MFIKTVKKSTNDYEKEPDRSALKANQLNSTVVFRIGFQFSTSVQKSRKKYSTKKRLSVSPYADSSSGF